MRHHSTLAKNLRKRQTPQEQKLWRVLRNRQFSGYKFYRQYVIEPYIVDFICRELKLIIELDGGHHSDQIEYDHKRSQSLEQQGFTIIRFWNHHITNQFEDALNILHHGILRQEKINE